ncbi:tolloid-like protein 2 [Oculina patagonica]
MHFRRQVILTVLVFLLTEMRVIAGGSACNGQTQTIDLSFSRNDLIYSPGYPYNYSSRENCKWLIKAPYGDRVLLYFTTFDVEYHAQCSYDSVRIFDGINKSAFQLSKRCGRNLPPPVYSSGRYIYMQFTSDGYFSGKGFVAHYRALNRSSGCPPIVPEASAGVIYSPNFPWNYPSNISCDWLITARWWQMINFTFTVFNLGSSYGNCSDYFEVRREHSLIGKYCGTQIPSSVKLSGSMRARFYSDPSAAHSGFMAFYHMEYSYPTPPPTLTPTPNLGCGGQKQTIDLRYTRNGSIYSPGYPNNYDNDKNCHWLIKAPYRQKVLVYFTTFDLEYNAQCRYDSVNIFDGQNSYASLLSKSCGSSLPPPVYSSGKYIYMQFISDGSVSRKGFVAHYKALNRSSGRFL